MQAFVIWLRVDMGILMKEQIENRVEELKALLLKLGQQDMELAQKRQEVQVAAVGVQGAISELERLLKGETNGETSGPVRGDGPGDGADHEGQRQATEEAGDHARLDAGSDGQGDGAG